MAPKRSKTMDEIEVDTALHTLKTTDHSHPPRSAASVSEQLAASTIHLTDGSTLDITALINASLESILAKKGASSQTGVVNNFDMPGPSGVKRVADPNDFVAKRRRPSETEEADDDDDDDEETDCTASDEDESEILSHVIGDRVNPMEAAKLQTLQSSRHGRIDEWSFDGSSTDPSRSVVLNLQSQDIARDRNLDDRSSEVSSVPPSQVPLLHSNDPSAAERSAPAHIPEAQVIDEGLHVPKKKVTNWTPSVGILNWANLTFDEEWSADQVKEYEDKYVPSKEYRHLFTPIPLSKTLEDWLGSQSTKDFDYLFNRRETERLLFRGSRDICASYGPLVEVLDLLGKRGDCKDERIILSEGILGIASALLKITRARRELVRRFFKLDISKTLYSFDPSHEQFFGGSSLGERVKQAQEVVTARNSMFFLPQKKSFPNKGSKGTNQGYNSNKTKGFQDNASATKQPSKPRRQSRGRGRRGQAAKGRNSKSPADKSK